MMRRSQKLLKDMSTGELARESKWHAARAEKLFEKVREMRERALTVSINEAVQLMHSAMDVEFEAQEHVHHSNVLDSVRAARLPDQGTRLVVSASKAYTVRQRL